MSSGLTSSELAPLVDAGDLGAWGEAQREAGRRIVMTNGCFDLLHSGHVASLIEAAGLGDVLLVAINDDASVRLLKGDDRPVFDQKTRATVLRALRAVGAVTIFTEQSSLPTIEAVRPDVLAKGGEYTEDEIVGSQEIRSWGGKVVRLSMLPGHGTTEHLSRLRSARKAGKEKR